MCEVAEHVKRIITEKFDPESWRHSCLPGHNDIDVLSKTISVFESKRLSIAMARYTDRVVIRVTDMPAAEEVLIAQAKIEIPDFYHSFLDAVEKVKAFKEEQNTNKLLKLLRKI